MKKKIKTKQKPGESSVPFIRNQVRVIEETQNHYTDSTSEPNPTNNRQKISAKTHKYCFSCGCKALLSICSGCGCAGYCSRECQKTDWGAGGHRYRCKNEQVPLVFSEPVIRLGGVNVIPIPQASVN